MPAWDDDPQSLAFATHRGCRVDSLIIASRLDLTAFDERRCAGATEAVRAAGVRLFSLAEVADTPAHRRRLYDLYRETWLDAPAGAGWVERLPEPDAFAAPLFRPDAAEGVLLAADGAAWIGFTHLTYGRDPRTAHQAMTGVRRTHRGRGVAQALKLLAIQRARARGVVEIETGNDSRNAAMLAINRELGFRPTRGQVALVRRFCA